MLMSFIDVLSNAVEFYSISTLELATPLYKKLQ